MKAGNAFYTKGTDLPEVIPVFPLARALLLPGCKLPLNIFEPRYLAMVDHALAGGRVIGMVQPRLEQDSVQSAGEPELSPVGCIGRLVSFAETGDGRYLISLQGICRFRCEEEIRMDTPFRNCRVVPFPEDLGEDRTAGGIDQEGLLRVFRAYLEGNSLEADWESVDRTENGVLVNTLAMMAPYGAAEKQALLEAPDLKARAETLVALTELALARGDEENRHGLQ